MATLIGDVFTDSSRFHNMISGSGRQHQNAHAAHSHGHDPHYRNRSTSRSQSHGRDRDAPPSHPATTTANSTSGLRQSTRGASHQIADAAVQQQQQQQPPPPSSSGASRFPSPPSSTSSATSSAGARPQHGDNGPFMAPSIAEPSSSARLASSVASTSTVSSTSTATTVIPSQPSQQQIPSPASDSAPRWNNSLSNLAAQSSAMSSPPTGSPVHEQTTIRIRDLAHIQSLARQDKLFNIGSSGLNDPPLQAMKYEISGMPINDIIEMVAALLTKITTTNDLQHDALNRNAAHIRQAQAAASRAEDGSNPGNGGEYMSPLSSSVLAFHGKNVPAITILSYLSRIHKYCPTTYEVFLSLLVYFDRMTERVNDMVIKAEEARRHQQQQAQAPPHREGEEEEAGQRIGRPAAAGADAEDTVMHDDSEESDETDSDLADDDDDDDDDDEEPDDDHRPGARIREAGGGAATGAVASSSDTSATAAPLAMPVPQATYFVVDSFNIHRLVIAGVTCASKFFSDVFYTNSRYAKVGGLPLAELNHLELQFLLLNDFRLAVPVEDLEAYATMLVEFYAREVVTQRSRPAVGGE